MGCCCYRWGLTHGVTTLAPNLVMLFLSVFTTFSLYFISDTLIKMCLGELFFVLNMILTHDFLMSGCCHLYSDLKNFQSFLSALFL